eukprot:CAMPEP_0202511420 /NCGR_PEP_ID=MMETSP1361-20130828/53807_1 /ASSEMBLY_ACC=CAM_ASM_000849 /TAXON_ID=210615 /ORGANISM="Staurosira complex sp., Strain CCMP2646" /LENGTH=148 /DNA_ID=CAMNT_0049145727 /DNA_START=333 /DNA_END=774 /DNA_ORIENTATION=+
MAALSRKKHEKCSNIWFKSLTNFQSHFFIDKISVPLFIDKKKQPIFQGNSIELCGLKAVQFNGKPGYIQGPADVMRMLKVDLRFNSSLDPKDCKSFKQENITYLGETTIHDAMLRHLRIEHKDEEFFQGLLERTRMLDILKHETWSNV